MRMTTCKKTILSLCLLTAAASLTATGLCAQKTSVSAQETAPVERLLSPTSYEEYLRLSAPTDVAATDGFIAVADGNILYAFNRDSGVWQQYVHTNPITKIDFGGREELFFLDQTSNSLYKLNVRENTQAVDTGIVCTTFSICEDKLYCINISAGQTSICFAPLSDLTALSKPYTEKIYSPALSFYNGEIYYVYGMNHLYKLNPETNASAHVAELPGQVPSMTVSEGVVFCVTDNGGFYGYQLSDLAEKGNAKNCDPVAEFEDGYTAVSANGSDVYLVRERSIRKFSLKSKEMTDYEIGASSDSKHRFDGASETLLAGQRLFIADDGNDRISVYDTQAQAFQQPIATELDAPFMASYGETLLVSTSSQAVLYSLNEESYGQKLTQLTSDKVSGTIVGAVAVYDNYYLVTDTNYCYTLTLGETGYAWQETLRKARPAERLASDANGYLYALNADMVYRYTEESFNSPTEQGVKICENIPADTEKIAVDYAGNLYALANDTLYAYAVSEGVYEKQSEMTFDEPLVYGVTPAPLSFAFGIEENEAYILYEGNYITVTTALDLPTVKTIPTENITSGIFGNGEAEFSVAQTLPNSLCVEIDLAKLDGASEFPYLSYYRSETPITGLKIGETADYALLCFRENAESEYKTLLVAKNRQTELSDNFLTYDEPKKGYLTNAAMAYKFPSMGLPTLGQFTKGAEAVLLGEVNGLDGGYYAVELDGKTVFAPKSHVTLFNGAPPASQTVTVGETGADKDSILRVAYLLLGAGAICILVDYLILRKKDKEE